MADLLPVDVRMPEPDRVRRAVEALARGELVVFPTETVYGLAADPRVAGAAERVYAVKCRDEGKPLAYLLADAGELAVFGVEPDGVAARLAAAFWPGPLTLVLPTEGGGSIGFRVPDHAVAVAVLRAAGGYLLVTSANRSGEAPAQTAQEAQNEVGDDVSIILDGGRVPGGVPSSVVKVTGENIEVLREGALSRAQIEAVY